MLPTFLSQVVGNQIALEVMRGVLATGLFAVGVEPLCAYMWEPCNGFRLDCCRR